MNIFVNFYVFINKIMNIFFIIYLDKIDDNNLNI